MAYGKLRVDTLTYDNAGSDVDVDISTIPSGATIAAKADLASPALTGTPTAPTAAQGTNTTQLATTAFVKAEITADLAAGNYLDSADIDQVGGVQGYDADTAKTDVAQTFTAGQRGDIVDVTGTTPNIDLNAGNNFRFTTSGNWTSFTVSNLAAATEGQTGSIFIVYGGADTGSFASEFRFVGGAAGIGALTSTASAVDRIDYIVLNSTTITCTITKNYVA